MKLYVQNNAIIANSGNTPDVQAMKPWRHACGVYWWTCTNADGAYTLNALTELEQRTLEEIEATPEFAALVAQQAIEQAAADAPAALQTMPEWLKSWTADEVEEYIETNVTDLASAKQVLKQLGKAVILIRDFIKIRL